MEDLASQGRLLSTSFDMRKYTRFCFQCKHYLFPRLDASDFGGKYRILPPFIGEQNRDNPKFEG